eukprot:TRINITY_DN80167_c0_g1_i1.p1 TRINITY_DN80167_c0_g1~~TRINITY_DN80167_c0_g1_i1.p1  ORF type:complete len:147 (-),score=18.44 TRINITY_DN80167_c0_g1_i1:87-527(-)
MLFRLSRRLLGGRTTYPVNIGNGAEIAVLTGFAEGTHTGRYRKNGIYYLRFFLWWSGLGMVLFGSEWWEGLRYYSIVRGDIPNLEQAMSPHSKYHAPEIDEIWRTLEEQKKHSYPWKPWYQLKDWTVARAKKRIAAKQAKEAAALA